MHSFQYAYSEHGYGRIGTNAAVFLALPLPVLALFAWFRPRAGGIASIAWMVSVIVAVKVISPNAASGQENTIYLPIYIVYLVGGIMHLFLPRKQKNSILTDARLQWAAIIVTFAAPVAYFVIVILVYTLHLPGGLGPGLIFFSPLAIIFGFAAVAIPSIFGTAIVILGGLFFSGTLVTDYYPMYYVPLSSILIIGGILHLMRERLLSWPYLSIPRLSPRI